MKFYTLVTVAIPLVITAQDVLLSIPDQEANSTSGGLPPNTMLVTEGMNQSWAFPKYFECDIWCSVDYNDGQADSSGDSETIFAYTLAVAGDKASITLISHDKKWKNSVLYFNADATKCDPKTSYQVSQFQVWDPVMKQGNSKKQCWMAPDNYRISGNIPALHATVFKYMFATSKNEFQYTGTMPFKGKH